MFLNFFRDHSAKVVVLFVVASVITGNLAHGNGNGGFLFGFLKEETTNEEKIKRRVKNYTARGSLAVVPLAVVAGDELEREGDIVDLMMNDADLNKNQMQYQVLSATTPDAKKLLAQGADVAVYEVKSGDSVGSIARDFGVTANTILWANDISDPNKIMPGDKIFVLPVTGVKHKVKKNETLKSIAKKYKADRQRILAFNDLPADGSINEGEELIIPDGKIEQIRATSPGGVFAQRDYSTKRQPSIIDRNPKGGHKFPYGYCTWYVAQHKYVPWGGHAGTWLYHAKAYGAKTGKAPKIGSIMVTSESWYGHVAIVTKIKGDKVTISEMNYKGFAVKSSRTISAKSRVIKGYIY